MNLTATLFSLLTIATATCSAQSLTIRLYDYANLSPEEVASTMKVATLTFDHSGIQLNWLLCRGAAAPAACETEMGTGDIIMRLVPRAPKAKDARTTVMADAVVNGQGGHYATTYLPAVRATAETLGVKSELLLGFVIAHEAVHCMLGPAHSRYGLMQAGYSRKDVGDLQRVSLGLSQPEARKLASVLPATMTLAALR